MNAIIYLRVSTEDQINNTSLESQERDCRRYAGASGYEVIEVIRDEGESAKTADRPGLLHLLSRARKKDVHAVIAWKVDRLSRNAGDYHTIRAALTGSGVKIFSATEVLEETPAGRFLETMLAGVAQFDNEVRAQRTSTGMQSTVEKGGWVVKAPNGYVNHRDEIGSTLAVDPVRGPMVREALRQFATGRWTQKQVGTYLGLHHSTTKKLLMHPVYAGFHARKEGEIAGRWEPLITRHEHNHILARMGTKPRVHEEDGYWLKGLLFCGACGSQARASRSRSKSGRHYQYYHCTECGCRAPVDACHAEVIETVAQIGRGTPFDAVAREVRDEYASMVRIENAKLREHHAAIAEIAKKKAKLLDVLLSGTIDEKTYQKKVEELTFAAAAEEVKAADTRYEFADFDAALADLIKFLGTPTKWFEDANLQSKQVVLKALFRHPLFLQSSNTTKDKPHKHLCALVGPDALVASQTRPGWNFFGVLVALDLARTAA